ncbi:MAG: gliding motility protein GldC [Cytophagales bacterium]|nr:MAG: gliding motility protein GldC [Cytophagales bacterium]
MRIENISIDISLDDHHVCENIHWQATNAPAEGISEAKAMALALWDSQGKGTAKIDLWTKKMDVFEMKQFVIETISGLADTIRHATEDEEMALEMELLCKQLGRKLEKDLRQ